jgi:hypothetical protein
LFIGISALTFVQGVSQKAFVDYFRTQWEPQFELWCKAAIEGLDHSDSYTNGAIESYHLVLKTMDLRGRRVLIGRRLDWLIKTLTDGNMSVLERYWYVVSSIRTCKGWKNPTDGCAHAFKRRSVFAGTSSS